MDKPADGAAAVVDIVGGSAVADVAKLSDTQTFARDPENYSAELTADTIARLHKIVSRQRKARQDEAEVLELAAKFKKTNAAAKRKKLKAGTDVLEEIV